MSDDPPSRVVGRIPCRDGDGSHVYGIYGTSCIACGAPKPYVEPEPEEAPEEAYSLLDEALRERPQFTPTVEDDDPDPWASVED